MADSPELDRLIASVAREITAADPSADLAARVLERLGERTRRRWSWTWALLPIAATAVAMAFVAFERNDDIQSRAATTIAATPIGPVAPSPATASSASEPVRTESVRKIRLRTPRADPSADALAWQQRAIPALSRPDALALEAIQPKALDIRPLETAPLAVPPLGDVRMKADSEGRW